MSTPDRLQKLVERLRARVKIDPVMAITAGPFLAAGFTLDDREAVSTVTTRTCTIRDAEVEFGSTIWPERTVVTL